MGKHVRHLRGRNGTKPTAAALLNDPLEFIHEDHLREREICASIDKIAQNIVVSAKVTTDVITFLTKELLLHLMDEEEDLFPLLKRRCEHEDEIGKIIARLRRDHAYADKDTPIIVALLETLIENPRTLDAEEASALANYVAHARRHLILENAIILPFARLRLTKGDLETLSIRMCQRRGISNLKGTPLAQGPA